MGLKKALIGLGLASLVRAVERRVSYTSNSTFNTVSFTPEAPVVSTSASADVPAFSYDPSSSSTADQHGVANLSMSTLPQNHSYCEITTVTVFSPLPTVHPNDTGSYSEKCKGATLQVPNATLVTWYSTILPWITSMVQVDSQASTWTVIPNTESFNLQTEMSYYRALTELDENGQVTEVYRRPKTNVPVLPLTTMLEFNPKVYRDAEPFSDKHGTGFPPLLEQPEVTPYLDDPFDGLGFIYTGSHVVWFTHYEIVRASTTTDRDARPTCTTTTEAISLATPATFLWENHGQLDSISEVVSELPLSIVTSLRYVNAEQFVFTAVPTLVVPKYNELLVAFNESSPWIEVGSEEIELPWEPDKNPRLPVDVPAMPTEDAGNGGPQMTAVIGGSSTTFSKPVAVMTPPPFVNVIDGQVFVPRPISSQPRRPPPPATAVMKGVTASSFAVPVFSSLADTGPVDPNMSEVGPSDDANDVGVGGLIAAGIGSGSWQSNQGSGQPGDDAPDFLPQEHSGTPGSNNPSNDRPNPPRLTQTAVPGVQSDSAQVPALAQAFDPIGGTWVAIPASVIPGSQDKSGPPSSSDAVGEPPSAGLEPISFETSVGMLGSMPLVLGESLLLPTRDAIYYVEGQRLVSGGPSITLHGRTISASPSGGGLLIDGRFVEVPTPKLSERLTIEGLEVMIEPSSAYTVNGSMLQAGAGPLDVGQGTTVSLGASGMAMISNNKTTMIAGQHMSSGPMLLPLGSDVYTANAAYRIRIQDDITLTPGTWTLASKTRMGLATKATAAMINGVQLSLSSFITPAPQISLAGTVYIPNAGSSYLIGTNFLTPGGKASIPSYNLSLQPDCISVIINNVSVPLTRPSMAYPYLPGTSIFAPPHLTLDNTFYTPLPPSIGGGYNISSTHLAPKSPVTVTGPHGPSIIALLPDHTLLLTHQRQTYTSALPLHQGIHPASPLPPLLTLASQTFTPLPGDIPRYVLGANITLTAGLNATATFSSLSPSKIVDGELAEVSVTVLTVAMARNLSALTVEEKGERRTEALFPATARAWEEVEREREREKEAQATPGGEGREMAGPAGEGQGESQAGAQEGRGGEIVISWSLALLCLTSALVGL
ncbi:hypothetical protein BDZ85DRAFT_318123 [Elsinoe ampelina]|uniref:Uncharacterized protein n=1 Tax=Elsinoe ampelina TaxID=302913 RepID=A0A6A6GFE6_9PEZI|nr:hypothetical protein BDZ85DRAFT_318123 [Elsinoe ampelina]